MSPAPDAKVTVTRLVQPDSFGIRR